jgi:uncharacterized cupin superfamily protein
MTDDARRHPHVINLDETEAMETSTGSKFGARIKQLGNPSGAKAVGCNWYEVAPGRSAFPAHYHCAIEEALFILDGEGTLRIGEEKVPVRAGDYVTLPAGPDHAHRLDNTSDAPLRYLCISSKAVADVVGYPDSGKLAAIANPSPNYFDPPWVRAIFPGDATVGYFDGEETD